ncbi:peptide chain release factor N(5)-glutamine methyltransferase [Pseudovibrio exalbescens]|uniref:Release factor glutamine methyltransferase n=1 Tax=Pseudovibrio exalbescens TaxID=197461 RepID=A0A1U7JJD4_9HYPH|nr:peptide chain release factor N(5)-glutamine methyltransferase [Pseudovibrio exalbescens]OKL44802.1 hypothetical protein A3843_05720 [Pseudovibrio exalbescens]
MSEGAVQTFQQAFLEMRDAFRAANVSEPDLDARYLLAAAAGLDPKQLPFRYGEVASGLCLSKARDYMAKRLSGMPVGRILGEREFWGLTFKLSEGTLEPRPDTEVLVEAVLSQYGQPNSHHRDWVFADIGTGTGAIAVALLTELPNAFAVAVDISSDALHTARQNAIRHRVAERMAFVRGSYLSCLAHSYDFIVSNPPYIRGSVVGTLAEEVRKHDPIVALDGGPDGLDAYRELIGEADKALKYGGSLFLEIGWDQMFPLRQLIEQNGFFFAGGRQDLAGNDRVVVMNVD